MKPNRSAPSHHFTLAFMLAALFASTAQADVAAILAGQDDNEKCETLIKARKNLSAADVMQLARQEKSDIVVCLALGIYIETGKPAAAEAANVIAACAARRTMFGDAALIAALSGQAASIAGQYVPDDRLKNRTAGQLAGAVLAMFARTLDLGAVQYRVPKPKDFAGGPPPDAKKQKAMAKQRQAGKRVKPQINAADKAEVVRITKVLLATGDEETLEFALITAAHLELEDVADLVEGLSKHRSNAIQALRQYYLARIGKPLEEETLTRVLRSVEKIPQNATKASAFLSNYEITTSAHSYACQAIEAAPDEKVLPLLTKAMDSRDLRVQIDAARALEAIASPQAVPVLTRAMARCEWPVLVSICSALGAIPSTDSFDALIKRLGEEKGRFRLDVNHALASIAGKQHGRTAQEWQAWWESNKDFKPDPVKTDAFRSQIRVQDVRCETLGFFYHAPIFSDRLAFVLDTSASMKGDKIENLKQNLTMTLESLAKHVRFNVVDFGGHVAVMMPGRLMNAAAGASAAIQNLGYLKLTLGTRSYDGLEAGVALNDIDTIIYLSDGAPVASKLTAWSRIVRGLHILNRYRPIAMFTVEFKAGAANAAAMEEVAARNHGLSSSPNP